MGTCERCYPVEMLQRYSHLYPSIQQKALRAVTKANRGSASGDGSQHSWFSSPANLLYAAPDLLQHTIERLQNLQMPKKKASGDPTTHTAKAGGRKKSLPPLTRDVGKQSKGPRLQRLRAVLLLVKATADYPDTNAFAAVEFQGDVFLATADATKSDEYVEENKNYDPSVSFTMNRHEVVNSLVAFCDLWVSKGCSRHVHFGYYTPNGYTTENETERTKRLGIDWPDEAMLKYLTDKDFDNPKVLAAAKSAVIDEYLQQASKHDQSSSMNSATHPLGNLSLLRSWSDDQWKDFFKHIEWKFGEDDADTIMQSIVEAIQASPAYNSQLAGKEEQIIALLLDRIDRRQAVVDPTQRFVHVAEVILAFKEVETGTVTLPDPTWEMWSQLPAPSDTRNIEDKVTAFCPGAPQATIARLSRRAAASMIEQRSLGDDKQVLALKFQIYDACEEALSSLQLTNGVVDESQFDTVLQKLLESAAERFTHCSQQYHYKMVSLPSVQAMVYELFDSCYLSFDQGGAI